jgi:hypothetical protein
MNSFFKKRTDNIPEVKINDLRTIFILSIPLYALDLFFHYYTTPLIEFIFRPIHTLILLAWFVRVSPSPFITRNILMLIAVFVLIAYPFQSRFFGDPETETYLEIILPFITNILLIIVFLKERKISTIKKSPGVLANRYFLYIGIPLAYYYFVVYQTLLKSSYFGLTLAYTVFFIAMLMTGSNLNFTKRSQSTILMALALVSFTTAVNTYNIFIEKIPYSYPVICFLNMISPLFFLWGFANEDIVRNKAGECD